jgi:hypothetical protein
LGSERHGVCLQPRRAGSILHRTENQETTMKEKILAIAGALAMLAASYASASAHPGHCGPGYKKVGNYCITKAYNPNLKLKAR